MTTKSIVLIMASLALAAGVQAAERGTPSEAKAMLDKAIAHYAAVGRKQALADFNAGKTPFSDRDLYVFCVGPDGSMVANGGYPSFVGKPVDVLKDANGKALGKSLIDAAALAGAGSVEYPHVNPVSRKPEPKVSYVQKVGEDVCGVGAYKGD
jgi:cytochrome c